MPSTRQLNDAEKQALICRLNVITGQLAMERRITKMVRKLQDEAAHDVKYLDAVACKRSGGRGPRSEQ